MLPDENTIQRACLLQQKNELCTDNAIQATVYGDKFCYKNTSTWENASISTALQFDISF